MAPRWQEIDPAAPAPLMIGHWHRPPLALVFERADGSAVEVGTGDDLWRWEQSLGYGVEAGSYKVTREDGGIRLLREPLMCCEPFTPKPRDYRFTWYAAWRAPGATAPPALPPAVALRFDRQLNLMREAAGLGTGAAPLSLAVDVGGLAWPENCRRSCSAVAFAQGDRAEAPCWECASTQNALRRVIRQLAAARRPGSLTVRGATPWICWDPAHLERRGHDALTHWDMIGLLDFSVWARQQLGLAWDIRAVPDRLAELPSLACLFGPNGFELEGEPGEPDEADV